MPSFQTRPFWSTIFDNDGLVDRVRGLPNASRLIEWERNQHPDGFINIERLMTRLDQLMPYDLSQNADDEYRFLLAELKRAFLYRLSRAREGQFDRDAFDAFASHCATNQFDCVTFNYDDFLDEALSDTGRWTPVWTLAFETLTTAKKVTFIGYSFPSTDLAARTLFSEALRDLPRENICVVDLATEEADIVRFKSRYRGVLGEIPDHRFSFDGAGPWIRTLVDAVTDRHGSPPNPI